MSDSKVILFGNTSANVQPIKRGGMVAGFRTEQRLTLAQMKDEKTFANIDFSKIIKGNSLLPTELLNGYYFVSVSTEDDCPVVGQISVQGKQDPNKNFQIATVGCILSAAYEVESVQMIEDFDSTFAVTSKAQLKEIAIRLEKNANETFLVKLSRYSKTRQNDAGQEEKYYVVKLDYVPTSKQTKLFARNIKVLNKDMAESTEKTENKTAQQSEPVQEN